MDRESIANSVTDIEQRSFIKISLLLDNNAKQIHDNLRAALGNRAYPYPSVRRWAKDIREGRVDVGEQRGGAHNIHPERDQRIERIQTQLDITRGWSLRMLALVVDVPKSTLGEILANVFHLTKRLGKLVPHFLNEDQKQTRVDVCYGNLRQVRRNPKLLDRTVAIDETWVRLYSPAERDQRRYWLRPDEQGPSTVAPELRERKAMLIMAMDITGVAFWHLCDEGQTVTGQVYRDFLAEHIPVWMAEKGVRKPMLLHDNARPHKAVMVREYLEENNIGTWCHPAYSPDAHTCDFEVSIL